jgi:ribose transport system substrate-binding protein
MRNNAFFRAGIARSVSRRLSALAAAGVLAVGLAACGGPPGSVGEGQVKDAGQPLKLGISMPQLDNQFFNVLVDDATKAAEAVGGSVVQTTDAKHDAGQQVTDFRNLITAGANAILAGIVDTKAIEPALDYAASQGVPVVIVDDQPTGGEVAAVVKADNIKMANEAAEKLASLIPNGGKVLEISGDPATTNGRDRNTGFNDVMQSKYPNIEVISQTAKWDGATAGSVANAIMSQNPDLAGIYLATDTLYLEPVSATLAGRGDLAPSGAPNHVPMVAIDGGAAALKAIEAGTLDATISQPVDLYAKYGVQYLQDARAGKKLATGPTDHGSTVVQDGDYLVDLLPAPVVTKDNVSDPGLWANSGGPQ